MVYLRESDRNLSKFQSVYQLLYWFRTYKKLDRYHEKSKLEKLEKFFFTEHPVIDMHKTFCNAAKLNQNDLIFLISECNLKLRLKTSFWIEIALVQANCFYQKKNSEGRCPCNFITNRLGIENSDVFLAIAWKLVDHCKQSGSKSLNIGGQTRK